MLGIAIDADSVTWARPGSAARTSPGHLTLTTDGPVLGETGTFDDFLGRVGDPVPVLGADGTMRPAAELTGLALTAVVGGEQGPVTLAHPAHWADYELADLRRFWNQPGSTLVARPVAAAAGVDLPSPVLVVDVGALETEVSLVSRGRLRAVEPLARSTDVEAVTAAADRLSDGEPGAVLLTGRVESVPGLVAAFGGQAHVVPDAVVVGAAALAARRERPTAPPRGPSRRLGTRLAAAAAAVAVAIGGGVALAEMTTGSPHPPMAARH